MMRAPKSFAVVVRRRSGSLHVREHGMAARGKGIAQWPFARGIATLVESLRLGGEALRFSAEQFEKDLATDEGATPPGSPGAGFGLLVAWGLALFAMVTGEDGATRSPAPASAESKSSGGARNGVMLLVAIGFFVALPQAAAAGINRVLSLHLEVQSPPFQAMTGALKLAVVVGYLLAIRRIPEIRRVFQYHGAEHKTISTYEAEEALTVDNARKKTTMHPRCGTTFLVMVAIVSIVVFMVVGAILPRIHTGSVLADNALFFLEKLPFLPVLVAVTFELQRLFSRYCATGPLRMLLVPGFLVQRITTAEPDDDQLEVALGSLRVTLFRQEQGQVYAADEDVFFPSYDALLAAATLRAEARPARAA